MLWILRSPGEDVRSLNDPRRHGMRAALSHVTEGVLESPLLSCVFTWKHNVMGDDMGDCLRAFRLDSFCSVVCSQFPRCVCSEKRSYNLQTSATNTTFCLRSHDPHRARYVIDTSCLVSHLMLTLAILFPVSSPAHSPCLRRRGRSCTGVQMRRTPSSPCWARQGSRGSPLAEGQIMESSLLSRQPRGADSQWVISSWRSGEHRY